MEKNSSTTQSWSASSTDTSRGVLGLGLPVGTVLTSLFFAYVLLVAILRHQRERQMRPKFGYKTRESLKNMTNDDAFSIQNYIAELEFPLLFEKSLEFALFKTYGFESMASLLVATRQLTTAENVTKRYADTVVLIKEFAAHPPTSERTLTALSRMNYIHGLYQKQGKITNDGMLYTLSVFVTEPINWINRHEWRRLNDMETCAIATFWKSIGDAMGIDYSDLPSAREGWQDGLHWFQEVEAWAQAYEVNNMLPNEASRKTANFTMDVLLWHVPHRFRDMGTTACTVLMDERLRGAMSYDDPPKSYIIGVNAAILLRKWILRYLCLPRPEFLRSHDLAVKANPETGRYNFRTWKAHPWYVSKRARWGGEGWLTWLLPNGVLPGDDGDRYSSQGYRIEEIGPQAFLGKGTDTMSVEKERLRRERSGGCPFVVA